MAGLVSASPSSSAPLDMSVRIRLSVMMFLQFAIWGCWATVIGNYLKHVKYDEGQIGFIQSLMPLGGMIGPALLILSQVADRFVASQRLLGVFHLIGAGLVYWVATLQNVADYTMLMLAMFAYALLYNATLALTNSITFANVIGARDFPSIRVLGTIGWIAAGLTLDHVLGSQETPVFQTNHFLLLAAGLSGVLGVFSFFLPHTPPAGKPGDPFALRQALSLFKNSSFAVFFGVSFIITIVLAFYYSFTGLYLEKAQGVKTVASTMIWGQVAEIFFMLLLPWFLSKFGMKFVLVLGMLCWGVRYAFFSIGSPYELVFAAILMHGICFDFFFAAAFIHVDNEAPKEIRASAQALFSFLTYGLGMFLGFNLAGQLATTYKLPDGGIDWKSFWMVPSIGVLISMVLFVVFFRMRSRQV